MEVKEKLPTLEMIKSIKDDLQQTTNQLVTNVQTINGDLTNINNNVISLTEQIQEIIGGQDTVVITDTISGVKSESYIASISAGTYKVTIDSVTSQDTDADTSGIGFCNSTAAGTQPFAWLYCARGVNISTTITFSQDVKKIVFYASTDWGKGEGDQFSYTNFKLIAQSKPQDLSDYKSIANLCFFKASGSGTTSVSYIQEFLPGDYIIEVDDVTSSSDGGRSLLQFEGRAQILLKRGGPQLYRVRLVSSAPRLILFAGPSWVESNGYTFSFSNLKIWLVDKQFLTSNEILPPKNFGWDHHPLEGCLYRTENGIETVFNVTDFQPKSTNKTYWVSPSGSDSNDGTSQSQPFQTIGRALENNDARIIKLANGYYNFPTLNDPIVHSIAFIPSESSENGRPVIGSYVYSSGDTFTRIDETSVYKIAIDSNCVYDMDKHIAYTRMTESDAINTPGSYYVKNEETYVNILDHDGTTTPTVDRIKCCGANNNFYINTFTHYKSGTYTTYKNIFYFEGLTICGGGSGAFRIICKGPSEVDTEEPKNRPDLSLGRVRVYAKDCEFIGGTTPDLSTLSAACYLQGCESILQDCKAYGSLTDGFAYHNPQSSYATSLPCLGVEINCEGYNNGTSSDSNKNGSTIHMGSKIIRVNSYYHDNGGPNVADTHVNSKSWNLGCYAQNSITNTSSSNINFTADTGATMWLDSCTGFGSTTSLYVSTSDNKDSLGYVKNSLLPTISTSGNSIIQAY